MAVDAWLTSVRWRDVLTLVGLAVALALGLSWVNQVLRDLKGRADEAVTDPREVVEPLTGDFAAGRMTDEELARVRESAQRVIPPGPDTPPAAEAEGPG